MNRKELIKECLSDTEFLSMLIKLVFSVCIFITGYYLIIKEIGWTAAIGIFLLQWSHNINSQGE